MRSVRLNPGMALWARQLVFLPFVVVVLFFSSEGQAGEASHELRIGLFSARPPLPSPFVPGEGPDKSLLMSQISDPLIWIDANGNVQPALATEWKKLTPTDWRFQLRQNVVFHNGEAFDAESVLYSFKIGLDPKLNRTFTQFLQPIQSVEVDPKDPNAVLIHLKEPSAIFPRQLIFLQIIPAKLIAKEGIAAYNRKPIGTGPFEWVEEQRADEVFLKRNPKYWRTGYPRSDGLRFVLAPYSDFFGLLLSRRINFFPNAPGRNTLQAMETGRLKVLKKTTLYQTVCFLNNRGPLAQKAVRQALNYAINRDELIKFADKGNAIPVVSLVPEGVVGKNRSLKPYGFRPDVARSLLKQAGFSAGLRLKTLATDESETHAKIIQNQLAQIGVHLELEVVPKRIFIQKVGDFQRENGGTRPDYDLGLYANGNTLTDAWHLASWGYASSGSFSFLRNEEFDRRFKKAVLALTDADYERELQELDAYFYDESLTLFLTQRITTFLVDKSVQTEVPLSGGFVGSPVLSEVEVGG